MDKKDERIEKIIQEQKIQALLTMPDADFGTIICLLHAERMLRQPDDLAGMEVKPVEVKKPGRTARKK